MQWATLGDSKQKWNNVKRTIDILLHFQCVVVGLAQFLRIFSSHVRIKINVWCTCAQSFYFWHIQRAVSLVALLYSIHSFGCCKLHITRLMSLFVRLFIYSLLLPLSSVELSKKKKIRKRCGMSAVTFVWTAVASCEACVFFSSVFDAHHCCTSSSIPII